MGKPPRLPQFGIRRAQWHHQRIQDRLQKPDIKARLEEEHTLAKNESSRASATKGKSGWRISRGRTQYEKIFANPIRSMGLGKSLKDALVRLSKGKGEIRINEYGPGRGNALSYYAGLLRKRGIQVNATAIDLYPQEALVRRAKSGEIKLIESPAETHKPTAETDAILEVYGPSTYTIPELRKDEFLKKAYTLAPGGIMLMGFDMAPWHGPNISAVKAGGITGGFSGKQMPPPIEWESNNFENSRRSLETALAKRGFRANFFRTNKQGEGLPAWALVVHRPK